MKFAVIGDIHGKIEPIKYICLLLDNSDIDFIILVGDIGPDFDFEDKHERSIGILYIESILKMLKTLNKPIFFVPGNHDYSMISKYIKLKQIFNVDYLTNKSIFKNHEINILGLGGSPTTPGNWIYEWNDIDIDIKKDYNYEPNLLNIFLSHSPPYGCQIDLNFLKQHCGSKRVAKLIKEHKFDLFLCGHIHESIGGEIINGIPCLNAGMVYTKTKQSNLHLSSFFILQTSRDEIDFEKVIIGYDSDSGYFNFKTKQIIFNTI